MFATNTPPALYIRKRLRANSFVSNLYYRLHLDNLPALLGAHFYIVSLDQVISKYLPNAKEDEKNRVRDDIRHCYLKYKISPTEYFLFNFRELSPSDRDEYLSDKVIYMTMGKFVGRKLHDTQLEDKFGFYRIAKDYFRREVMLVSSEKDFKKFEEFATRVRDIIIKPNSSACGYGITVEHFSGRDMVTSVFNDMMNKGQDYIVEELIHQSDRLASWNQSSVNTVRISSFFNGKDFSILCPFIRMGRRGAIVDNGGQGGLYAAIDAQTGKIVTDGKDELCNVYQEHPDSHIVFKGWQVPQWEELVELTKKIHGLFPKHKYVGWDFAHTKDGWVLIEGNWGEFIAQQSTMERGYKKEFMQLLNA